MKYFTDFQKIMVELFAEFPFTAFSIFSDRDVKESIHLLPFPDPQINYPAIITDSKEFSNTYIIEREGSNWSDMLYCGWPSLYVVNEKFRNTLDNITGINFYPVNILDKNLEIVNVNYYGFHIMGRCGNFISSLSRKEISRRVPNGPDFIKEIGLYFDPNTWDGSDFFVAEKTACILVSKRVQEIIKKNKLTNIRMRNITEIESFSTGK